MYCVGEIALSREFSLSHPEIFINFSKSVFFININLCIVSVKLYEGSG